MNERWKAFWIGLFLIASFVAITLVLLFLRPRLGDGEKVLHMRFTNVDRIKEGTHVTLAGKAVGEVKSICAVKHPRQALADSNRNLYYYEVTSKVDSSVSVYSYDEVSSSTSGILGERIILIRPKAAPEGEPPPYDISNQVIYAVSDDKMNELFNRVNSLTNHFEKTLKKVDGFFDDNSESIKRVTDRMSNLFERADELDIFGNFANTSNEACDLFRNLNDLMCRINSGQGTLGKLINNDKIFYKLSEVLTRAELLIGDINNFGILFQFDRNWQRLRKMRMRELQELYMKEQTE